MELTEVIITRHCVGNESGVSPLQQELLDRPEKVRIADAPTGAGKSYAFQQAMIRDERVLFIVPTRRLAQNLMAGLLKSLVQDNLWNEETALKKLALWTSDETMRLQESGETNVRARRIQEIDELDFTRKGGEMIITVPEIVSWLLLRHRPEKGQSDKGVFDMLNFDHIVFDEFHTISPRGFGMAGLFAKLAAGYPCRARVSFLSATPLDIRPVLTRLDVDENQVIELHEDLTDNGRVIHGDVALSLCRCENMVDLIKSQADAIREEIEKKRQVVIIYNALADLQRHLPDLEQILKQAGVKKGRVLLIDSIDDSRTHIRNDGYFRTGRYQDPEMFDILIATASVEMGVTFKSDFLIMEPGFEPLNFLQRYGRAARGDHDGHVLVRFDDAILSKNPWFRNLKRWLEKLQEQRVEIGELTDILSRSAQKRFKDCSAEGWKHFGRFPNRAAYTAGLYWNVLMGHFSTKGHRWKHLKDYQPKPAGQVYALLKKVRQMESDRIFGKPAKDWCLRFEQEIRTLRDIGKGVRVVEDDGKGEIFHAQEMWLRRNSDILDRFPLIMGEDGIEEVRIRGKLGTNLLEKKKFIKATQSVRFPHTLYAITLMDDVFIVESWCREFRNLSGPESMAWELYTEAMEAAEKLVRLTGLIVSEDTEADPETEVI